MSKKYTQEDVDRIIARHNEIQLTDPNTITQDQIDEATADFDDGDLRDLDFSGKFLQNVDFSGADLRGANFNSSVCKNALFTDSDLRGANLIGVDLTGAFVKGVKYSSNTKCRGINASGAYGSPSFKRFAEHQDFIEEFKSKRSNLPVYYLWLVLSNCGRSLALWSLWSIVLSVCYGVLFYYIGSSSFVINESLKSNSSELFIMIYYSVVTFTTLGFGDVTPVTTEAALAVMCEVITGYLMLGGLISIFSNKLVER